MIKCYRKPLKSSRLKVTTAITNGIWVHAEKPTETELDWLAEQLALDRSLLTDGMDMYEVPRVEQENGVAYVFIRVPAMEKGELSTLPLLIAIGKKFTLTLTTEKMPLWGPFFNNQIHFLTTQKTKFFFQIVKEVHRLYRDYLGAIGKQVRQAQVNVEVIGNRDILKFVRFESVTNDFLAALMPMNQDLKELMRGKTLPLYKDDEDLIEDLFLSSGQLIETAKTTLRTIVNIRDAYSIVLSHNLNRVMKLLTSLTIVLTIPTIIGSLWGMNVAVPLAQHPQAFHLIGLLNLLLIGLALMLFIKNKWF